jgi:DNA-binding protein YbaB
MDYKKATEELTKSLKSILEKDYEGQSAGKVVEVKIKTNYPQLGISIIDLKIADRMISKKNKDILQDLIIGALNNAVEKMETEFVVVSKKYVESINLDTLNNLDSLNTKFGNNNNNNKAN